MPFGTLKEILEPLLPSIILALMGSLARFCVAKTHTASGLLRGLIISGFAGAIASLLLVDVPLSLNTKIAMGGMAGFAGDWFLNALARRLIKKTENAALHGVSGALDSIERRDECE